MPPPASLPVWKFYTTSVGSLYLKTFTSRKKKKSFKMSACRTELQRAAGDPQTWWEHSCEETLPGQGKDPQRVRQQPLGSQSSSLHQPEQKPCNCRAGGRVADRALSSSEEHSAQVKHCPRPAQRSLQTRSERLKLFPSNAAHRTAQDCS